MTTARPNHRQVLKKAGALGALAALLSPSAAFAQTTSGQVPGPEAEQHQRPEQARQAHGGPGPREGPHRRGVDVRVLLDPNQVYNRHAYSVLRDAGVEVRWYPVPRGVLLHAKIGLFDGLLVLGSANWTLSGLGVNHELDIETKDVGAVGAYQTRFAADWERSPGA